VRPNLAAALSHIRDADVERRIWIDALCINQSDVTERNQQVHMMGRTYSNAERVLVWIGLEDDQTQVAMDVFNRVWERYDSARRAQRR